jgi:hypothetical protein
MEEWVDTNITYSREEKDRPFKIETGLISFDVRTAEQGYRMMTKRGRMAH